jgi:hypothetical protein
METEERRNILLDKGTHVPEEDLTLEIGGHEVDVVVRAMTRKEMREMQRAVLEEQGEIDRESILVQRCTYDPATGDRLFAEEDLPQIDSVPAHQDSWVAQITDAIDYVHGYTDQAPDGVGDPRYMVIAQQAQDMQEVIRDSDDITGELATKLLEAHKSIEQNALGIEPAGDEGK